MTLRIRDDGTVVSEKKPKKNVIPIRLNDDDYVFIEDAKQILEQPKTSTVLKQLAYIGYLYIKQSDKQNLLKVIFENKRKNKRLGIVEFEL